MNGPKLGELITHNEKRDAIHIAVLPVVAAERLKPGMHVRFTIPGNTEVVGMCHHESAVGIVDPFLTVVVQKGESCWLFMMPNTITSLRHEWSHPMVDGEDRRGISEFWLREFAIKYGLTYDYVVESADRYNGRISTGDSEYEMDDGEHEQLAKHLSVVLGKEVASAGFSCAC